MKYAEMFIAREVRGLKQTEICNMWLEKKAVYREQSKSIKHQRADKQMIHRVVECACMEVY